MKPGFLGFIFAAFAAASASSFAFFSARSAALLFVRGAIVGAEMLLGRRCSLGGAVPPLAGFAPPLTDFSEVAFARGGLAAEAAVARERLAERETDGRGAGRVGAAAAADGGRPYVFAAEGGRL